MIYISSGFQQISSEAFESRAFSSPSPSRKQAQQCPTFESNFSIDTSLDRCGNEDWTIGSSFDWSP